MQNCKTDYMKKMENLKIWFIIVVIVILALIVIPHFSDINTEKTIRNDIAEVENLLETYLIDNGGISEGLRTEIDIKAKVIEMIAYDSEGIIESIDLNKDYYRIPGLINVLVGSKLDGNFICDMDGNVYYIHNRVLN